MDSICPHFRHHLGHLIHDFFGIQRIVCAFFTTSAKEGVVGCFLISLRAAFSSCQTFFVDFDLFCLCVDGISGNREVCRVRALQLAHLAGALADFVHSEQKPENWSFPFSKRPLEWCVAELSNWSRSSVALLCESITMGAIFVESVAKRGQRKKSIPTKSNLAFPSGSSFPLKASVFSSRSERLLSVVAKPPV
ncbi:hypothetical protein TNCV_2773471 [Trichonephila clavipes]|nr:hypothetical protein TNCV_2773471 [Trichonephila clavipes]